MLKMYTNGNPRRMITLITKIEQFRINYSQLSYIISFQQFQLQLLLFSISYKIPIVHEQIGDLDHDYERPLHTSTLLCDLTTH